MLTQDPIVPFRVERRVVQSMLVCVEGVAACGQYCRGGFLLLPFELQHLSDESRITALPTHYKTYSASANPHITVCTLHGGLQSVAGSENG